jgi:hypothetical protein
VVFRADQETGRDLAAVDWISTPLGRGRRMATKPAHRCQYPAVVPLFDVDGVAVLLYRQPAPMEMKFSADVNHLGPSRAALRTWLTEDFTIHSNDAGTTVQPHARIT